MTYEESYKIERLKLAVRAYVACPYDDKREGPLWDEYSIAYTNIDELARWICADTHDRREESG